MKKEVLTTGQIAQYCHVTYRAVLKWIEKGKLKAHSTPGGHHRVSSDDFLTFLKIYNMPLPPEFAADEISVPRQYRILIVDDDRNMVLSLQRLLRMAHKYDVETAFDGFEAGSKVVTFHPDVVILDIRMPGMDGYEVVRRMKQMQVGKGVKIIVVSAFFQKDGKHRMKKLGVDECIDKPFENEKLLGVIREVCTGDKEQV